MNPDQGSPVLFEDQPLVLDATVDRQVYVQETEEIIGNEHNVPVQQVQRETVPSVSENDNDLSEYLQFRNTITELSEELKSRRAFDKLNEEKIASLLTENQQGQKLLESEKNFSASRQHEFDSEILRQKRIVEEKVRDLENEKAKYSLSYECGTNENKLIKETVRNLQIAKHGLQQQVTSLERSLKLQTSLKDSCMKQIQDLECKCRSLEKRYCDVEMVYRSLQASVTEAAKWNKDLYTTNERYKVMVSDHEKQVVKLREDLAKISVKVAQTPQDLQTFMDSKNTQIKLLKDSVQQKASAIDNLQKILEELNEENQRFLNIADRSQNALAAQVKTNEKSLAKISKLEVELNDAETELENKKQALKLGDEKVRVMEEEYSSSKGEWDKMEDSLKLELKDTKEKIDRAQKELSDSRLAWQSIEFQLKEDIAKLKEKYDKDFDDVEVQVSCDVTESGNQTDEDLVARLESLTNQNAELEKSLKETETKLEKFCGVEDEYGDMKTNCQAMQEAITEKDLLINQLNKTIEKFNVKSETLEIAIQTDRECLSCSECSGNVTGEMLTSNRFSADSTRDSSDHSPTSTISVTSSTSPSSARPDTSALGSVMNWVVGKLSRSRTTVASPMKVSDEDPIESSLGSATSDEKIEVSIDGRRLIEINEESVDEPKAKPKLPTIPAPSSSSSLLTKYQSMINRIEPETNRSTLTSRSKSRSVFNRLDRKPALEFSIGEMNRSGEIKVGIASTLLHEGMKRKVLDQEDEEEPERLPDASSILANFTAKKPGGKMNKKVRFADT